MARKRELVDVDRPLPTGLFKHGRQYRARRAGGGWQGFGPDYSTALKGYGAWRERGFRRNTIAWLLDEFTCVTCQGYVRAGKMAERTARDYANDAEVLKKGLGHFAIEQLTPSAIVTFQETRQQAAPSHVRNEMACLSAALRWAVKRDLITVNPALQVERPTRGRRMRLITHDEYLAVFDKATASVKIAMALAVRTLPLPGDLLAMGPHNLIRGADGRRILRFKRGKTGIWVEVAVEGELAALVEAHLAEKIVRQTFVSKVRKPHWGEPYTVDGIGAMFRRYCGPDKANVKDFGLRDLRAKGATDMYRADPTSIHQIQALLGHASVRTTEIYLKELVPQLVRPNMTAIIAEAK